MRSGVYFKTVCDSKLVQTGAQFANIEMQAFLVAGTSVFGCQNDLRCSFKGDVPTG